jgi:hypothetical protein
METSFFEKALREGHLRIDKTGMTEKIVYTASNSGDVGRLARRQASPMLADRRRLGF